MEAALSVGIPAEASPFQPLEHRESAKLINDVVNFYAQRAEQEDRTSVTWLTLADLVGRTFPEERERIGRIVRRAGRILVKKHGIFLVSVRDIGYRIAEPGEEIHLCDGRWNGGVSRCRRAVVESNFIRKAALSVEQQSEVIMWGQRHATLIAFLEVPVLS